jgi:GNAT superfamily N-acetyltransferase
LTTELARRRRLADPRAGLWEAADVQWWWTRDQRADREDQRVWLNDDDPVAAVLFTRFGPGRNSCDVIGESGFEPAWEFVAQRCAEQPDADIRMELSDGDSAAADAARRAGFEPTADRFSVNWQAASSPRPAPPPAPPGYSVRSRRECASPVHPLARRNGPAVEDRLHECSLYDPELDLAMYAPDGSPAGYALFWADPRTGVGLVEPMRVEDEHAGRGLARLLLGTGLSALAHRGCRRLKVTFEVANEPARRLYLGAGFVPSDTTHTWRRAPVGATAGST